MSDQMMDSVLRAQANGFLLSTKQQKYLEEYEKYKDVILEIGPQYCIKDNRHLKYLILEITEDEKVTLQRVCDNPYTVVKTAHWSKKNLVKE